MTTLEIKTGMTRTELEKFYISKINLLMSLGLSETESRQMVQETLKQTLGL
jgi:hypothetical protein